MQGQQTLKLYSYFRSSTSWRVRIVLSLKKLQYETIPVNLLQGEQKGEEYQKVNPNKGVPALVVNDAILIESMAISEYLEEYYPDTKLLPQDPVQRALIRGFCEIINSGMHPYQNLRMFDWIDTLAPGYDRIAFIQPILDRGYTALEQLLAKSNGKYCFGDQPTLADAFLVPSVGGSITRFKIDISKYPRVKSVYENLITLQAFIDASPEKQPDCK